MIELKSEYINATSGLLSAITLKSAEIVRNLLEENGVNLHNIKNAEQIDSIITHKNPHLDEYMAILLFRSLLPENKRLIPIEESILSSVSNDKVARATWPTAAVIGIGSVHNGGAWAKILLDEHVEEGKEQRSSSATIVVYNKYLRCLLPQALFRIMKEVDHIDANGGAHDKNLANYVKKIQETELTLQINDDGKVTIQQQMDSAWKEASVNACIIAVLLGFKDGKSFSQDNYWRQAALESIEFYKEHSAFKSDPYFDRAFSRTKGLLADFNKMVNKGQTNLTILNENNIRVPIKDRKGNPIRQLLMMPYIAALCKDYWGPTLGNIILAPFWESRIIEQIAFLQATEILEKEIRDVNSDYQYINTAIGRISLLHFSITHPRGNKKPLVLYLESRFYVKKALINFLNKHNDGLGYTILKNTTTGNIVLSKGKEIPVEEWNRLIEELTLIEGNSDARRPGCWHIIPNYSGIADFVLNGNVAHQYVPRSSLTAKVLVDLIERIHGNK